MAGDAGEKTESATPKRRGEARKRGQVAKSTELSSIFVLFGIMLSLGSLTAGATHIMLVFFQESFANLDDLTLTPGTAMKTGGTLFVTLMRAVGPLALLAFTLGVLVNVGQTGPLWAVESLRPNFMRLNPLEGAKRFVSPRALVELAKSLYKIGLIGYIAWITISASYPQLAVMDRMEMMQAVGVIGEVIHRMAMRIVVTMLILAVLDYAYQRWQFEKQMRMSKYEVKQEYKQQEVSPQLKSRIRARQREAAKKRMMDAVPDADVVITNPTHFAVALRYDTQKGNAPTVIAKGQDLIAMKIREVAESADVPIVENPPLARALYRQVQIGREVPEELYESVAEVLAFVYQINEQRRQRAGFTM